MARQDDGLQRRGCAAQGSTKRTQNGPKSLWGRGLRMSAKRTRTDRGQKSEVRSQRSEVRGQGEPSTKRTQHEVVSPVEPVENAEKPARVQDEDAGEDVPNEHPHTPTPPHPHTSADAAKRTQVSGSASRGPLKGKKKEEKRVKVPPTFCFGNWTREADGTIVHHMPPGVEDVRRKPK